MALGFCVNISALIFPLLPGADGSYDVNYNVLHSYSALWATNRHAMYNVGSQNAVAVAPRWLLTAWHVAHNMDTNWFFNDDTTRYYYRDKVDLGNDLALVQVDKLLPFYSQIQKFPGGTDDILTVYGQSAAPEEPIYDAKGVPKGWKFTQLSKNAALRWGKARRLPTPTGTIQWDFTANDVALGNGGLNYATANTNDSGGGIFVDDRIIGVLKGLWLRVSVIRSTNR